MGFIGKNEILIRNFGPIDEVSAITNSELDKLMDMEMENDL